MTDRNLTAVPSDKGAPSAPPDSRHPMERAREALLEAAVLEGPPLRDVLLRLARELPRRGRG